MHPICSRPRIASVVFLLVGLAAAEAARAQSSATTKRTGGATVSGLVTDSISGAALGGAVVQLVPAQGPARSGWTRYSDWLGRFTFSDVPDGRYTIGFFHPILDSLGVEAPVREVVVHGHEAVHVDLATPSAAQLRTAVCGNRAGGGIVVGSVRNASDGTPLPAATIMGEWLALAFTNRGIRTRIARLDAKTQENGWFALCNVPSAGTLSLIASRGADSTDLIEIEIPANGIVHRELYLGLATRQTVRSDTSASTVAPSVGAGLSGIVVNADDGKALVGAEVSVSRGIVTRTNERGEWTLHGVRPGTRMLEVRAVGYSPDRRPVDVADGVAPVRVTLSTLKATLDTVRVSGITRLHVADIAGFHERRRMGAGRYLTDADIERRGHLFASDIFRSMPGVQLGYAADTLPPDKSTPNVATGADRLILMRGASGQWCTPAIYVNGVFLPGVTAGDLNSLITTKDVAGVELYSAASVPAQFQKMVNGCGTVLIWRK